MNETQDEMRSRCRMRDLVCPTAEHVACAICGGVAHAGTGMWAALDDPTDRRHVCCGPCWRQYKIDRVAEVAEQDLLDAFQRWSIAGVPTSATCPAALPRRCAFVARWHAGLVCAWRCPKVALGRKLRAECGRRCWSRRQWKTRPRA